MSPDHHYERRREDQWRHWLTLIVLLAQIALLLVRGGELVAHVESLDLRLANVERVVYHIGDGR